MQPAPTHVSTVTTTPTAPPPFTPALERRVSARVSWSAIFAGTAVGVGVWLMLHLLGLGIGLTALDPDDAGSLKGVGIGAGVWTLVVPLIALFVGGAVAGRVAGVFDKPLGAIHGAVVWALTTIAFVTLVVVGVSSLVGTTARAAGAAASSVAELAGKSGRDVGDLASKLGLSTDDLVASVNRRLAADGKPSITSDQLGRALRRAASGAVRSGELDREALTAAVAAETDLTQAQASDVATRLEERWRVQQQKLSGQAHDLGGHALQAAESTGKGLLVAFGAMVLALLAAVSGAVFGTARWRDRMTRGVPPPRRATTAPPP